MMQFIDHVGVVLWNRSNQQQTKRRGRSRFQSLPRRTSHDTIYHKLMRCLKTADSRLSACTKLPIHDQIKLMPIQQLLKLNHCFAYFCSSSPDPITSPQDGP